MTSPARVIAELRPEGGDSRTIAMSERQVVIGPATVVSVEAQTLHVRVAGESGPRRARLALAVPYRAAEGDEVLVLGKRDDGAAPTGEGCAKSELDSLWVVGVLHSAGSIELEVPGDLTLRAVGGHVRIEGDRGVDVRGPEIRLEAGTLAIVATKAVQKLDALYQRVRGLYSVHAERVHTTVDEAQTTHAKSSSLLVEETASINGKQIHLG